jgi:hypothetical protein
MADLPPAPVCGIAATATVTPAISKSDVANRRVIITGF